MRSPQEAFADITALLEDMHGVSVEGQHPDLTEDHARVLCVSLTVGLARAGEIVAVIGRLPSGMAH